MRSIVQETTSDFDGVQWHRMVTEPTRDIQLLGWRSSRLIQAFKGIMEVVEQEADGTLSLMLGTMQPIYRIRPKVEGYDFALNALGLPFDEWPWVGVETDFVTCEVVKLWPEPGRSTPGSSRAAV